VVGAWRRQERQRLVLAPRSLSGCLGQERRVLPRLVDVLEHHHRVAHCDGLLRRVAQCGHEATWRRGDKIGVPSPLLFERERRLGVRTGCERVLVRIDFDVAERDALLFQRDPNPLGVRTEPGTEQRRLCRGLLPRIPVCEQQAARGGRTRRETRAACEETHHRARECGTGGNGVSGPVASILDPGSDFT
jgi:transposase